MRTIWEFFSTERIVFGNNSVSKLDSILKGLNAKNLLLITDQGVAQAGILDHVLRTLGVSEYQVTVFDRAVSEPPISTVMDCYEFAQTKTKPDVIIGLGGGSSIDLAKVVSLLLTHGGHPQNYFGENRVPGPTIPLIAIPTTAGTGSEVTSIAVVNDIENNLKVGISDQYLRPDIAIVDPELTVNLPPYVTACSGIDALSHAIEAFLATDSRYIRAEGEILFQGSTPLSDALAIQAIELISQNLILAVNQGSNIEARSNMLLGSLLAGMAFSNAGTAAAHALAYPIGGLLKSPHGEITGLLLPYVMKHNAMVNETKMLRIADAFHLWEGFSGKEERIQAVIDKVFYLLESIGLPSKLSSIGIQKEHLSEIATKALTIDRLMRNNSRMATLNSFTKLLQEAY